MDFRCREIGDDLHEPCGGLYFCPVCEGALKCVTVQQVF